MPAEDLAPSIELFRHRFLYALRDGKHISRSRLADLLSWKHSGFKNHDGGEKTVPAHDTEGRKRLAEYLPRQPPPPFDIETMEPIEPPWQAIKEWIPDNEPELDWFNRPLNPADPDPDWFGQTPAWKPEEIHLDDGSILVLEYT